MKRRVLLGLAIIGLVAGCGSSQNKLGGNARGKVTVLTLANATDQPRELVPFADTVARLSHGALRIHFANDWREHSVDFETRLIRDVADGRVDLGWVGARAWDDVGIHSFDALQAPLLIDSYALEQRVLRPPLIDRMLAPLRSLGLRGIGVLPGPLRRVVSTRPVERPSDFAGLRLGYQGSSEIADALRTLGASPVRMASGVPWPSVDGVESHTAAIAGNRYADGGHYITANLNLWPRALVVFAGPRALHHLTSAQIALLRQAALESSPGVLGRVRALERNALAPICDAQPHVVTASPADIAAFRQATSRFDSMIARDATSRATIAAIETVRAGSADHPDVFPGCAASASTTAAPAIPDGTYVSHAPGSPGNRGAGRLRLVIHQGEWVEYERRPSGHGEQIGSNGTLSEFHDHLELRFSDGYALGARWSFDGNALRITVTRGTAGDKVVWSSNPWIKQR